MQDFLREHKREHLAKIGQFGCRLCGSSVFGIEYMYASMLFHWQQFFLLVEYLKSSWPHVRAELIYNKNLGCHFINT